MSSGDAAKLETFLIVACRPLDSKNHRGGKPHKTRKLPFGLFSRLVKEIAVEQWGMKDGKLGRTAMVSIPNKGKDLLFASGTEMFTMLDFIDKSKEKLPAGPSGVIKADPRITRLFKPNETLPSTGLLQKLLLVRDELLVRVSTKVLDILVIHKNPVSGGQPSTLYSWDRLFHLERENLLRESKFGGLSDYKDQGVTCVSSKHGIDTLLIINGHGQLSYLNIWRSKDADTEKPTYRFGIGIPLPAGEFAQNHNLGILTAGMELIEIDVLAQSDNSGIQTVWALDHRGYLAAFSLDYKITTKGEEDLIVPVFERLDRQSLLVSPEGSQDLKLLIFEDFRESLPEETIEAFTTFVAHKDYLLVVTEFHDDEWYVQGEILSLYSISDILGMMAAKKSEKPSNSSDAPKTYGILPKSILNFESDSLSKLGLCKLQPIPLTHRGRLSGRRYELDLFLAIGSGTSFSILALWGENMLMISNKLKFKCLFPFLANSVFHRRKDHWQGVVCLNMEVAFISIDITP